MLELIQSEELQNKLKQCISPAQDGDQDVPPLSQNTFQNIKKLVNLIKIQKRPILKAEKVRRMMAQLKIQRALTFNYLQNYYSEKVLQDFTQATKSIQIAYEITRPFASPGPLSDIRSRIQTLSNEITKRLESEPDDVYFPELEESLRPKVEAINALMNDYNYALKMRYLVSQLYLLHHRIA